MKFVKYQVMTRQKSNHSNYKLSFTNGHKSYINWISRKLAERKGLINQCPYWSQFDHVPIDDVEFIVFKHRMLYSADAISRLEEEVA